MRGNAYAGKKDYVKALADIDRALSMDAIGRLSCPRRRIHLENRIRSRIAGPRSRHRAGVSDPAGTLQPGQGV
jgi:hypothetical protein